MDNTQRISTMKIRLENHLAPCQLDIEDESYLHAGHAGAKGGMGHFRLTISSDKFKGLRTLQKHQLIYQALGEMMQTDIHALSIHISD